MSKINHLNELLRKCERFTNDKSHVYKLCCDCSNEESYKREWLVILQKIEDTVTNEDRLGVMDPECAKFRANKLLVVMIINIHNPSVEKVKIVNTYCGKEITYEIGEISEADDFDKNLNEVCTSGIHYFNTLAPAYYYRTKIESGYTGHWIEYNENGQKTVEKEYLNGLCSGHWIYYDGYGKKQIEGDYKNDKKTGFWTEYSSTEQKMTEFEYIEGEETGHWINYDTCGRKIEETEIINGEHWVKFYRY